MLFFNNNIRSKITYRVSILFGELQYDKKELYSYSFYNEDFTVKEIRFINKQIWNYKYDSINSFLQSLKVYSDMNEILYKQLYEITRNETDIVEFEEYYVKGENVTRGKLELIDDVERTYKLSFHRVNSFLGYRKFLKLVKDETNDFIREEVYDSNTNELEYILLNEYEYFESEIERRALEILEKGW